MTVVTILLLPYLISAVRDIRLLTEYDALKRVHEQLDEQDRRQMRERCN